jgi:predicted negative regulator of RcsB-dependent stress response
MAFILALIIIVLTIVGYSYFEYGKTSQGLFDATSKGISNLTSLFQPNPANPAQPVQIGVIFIIGLAIGWALGHSSY